jgi:hypothetical protein
MKANDAVEKNEMEEHNSNTLLYAEVCTHLAVLSMFGRKIDIP